MKTGRVRLAEPADAAELARLRALMLEGLGEDPDAGTEWREPCRRDFERRLGDDLVAAVIPRATGGLAACAVGVVYAALPGPTRPDGRQALLVNVVTDLDVRRRGFARACVEMVLAELHDRGVTRIELHASGEGEGMYRTLGFAAPRYPALERLGG